MHFFAQLSSYKLESSLQVMKLLALLMLKQADGAKNETHPWWSSPLSFAFFLGILLEETYLYANPYYVSLICIVLTLCVIFSDEWMLCVPPCMKWMHPERTEGDGTFPL